MSDYHPKTCLKTTSKITDSQKSLAALAEYNQRMLGLQASETQYVTKPNGLDKLESMINEF